MGDELTGMESTKLNDVVLKQRISIYFEEKWLSNELLNNEAKLASLCGESK